jgi:hypothetical protein
LQRGRKAEQSLPPGSFLLREDASEIETRVAQMIEQDRNGAQICEALAITRGILQGILRRNDWHIARNAGRSLKDGNCKKVKDIIVSCGFCGKDNSYKPWQLVNKQQKFCDRICTAQYQETLRGEKSPRFKEEIERICKGCGETFSKKPGEFKRDATLFCNRPCYLDWYAQQIGPLSPRWKGGIGKYRGRNWGKQKEAAAKRDKYTCQLCGEFKGSAVHIHHIRPFSLFDDSVKANALSNLVALCASCHASVEGHTDNADVTNWKEAYEASRERVLGETQTIVDRIGADIERDYRENGLTRMQCLERYKVKAAVFYLAVYGKRDRRGTQT